jgi:uncharacterized damage-inducible protein DinB
MTSHAPDRTEAADYYFRYIDQVPAGDVRDLLERQARDMLDLLGAISDERSLGRYAADKWSIRQVVSHVIDTERVFVFRAFWFARGFESPLPSFDQDRAVEAAAPDDRSWRDLIADFRATRADSVRFFRSLSPEAWARRGIASDKPFTVRALAYLTVGHATHHLHILRDRYL